MFKWWAYRHVSGTLHVKRYYFPADLTSADESDFVAERTEVYEAETKEEASVIARGLLKGGDNTWDK